MCLVPCRCRSKFSSQQVLPHLRWSRRSRGQRCRLPPLRDGCNIKMACDICGVGETTFHEWRNRGRCEEPYASFFSETSRARDAFKADLLSIVVKAADKEAEWLLERYWPNEFGRSEPREAPVIFYC